MDVLSLQSGSRVPAGRRSTGEKIGSDLSDPVMKSFFLLLSEELQTWCDESNPLIRADSQNALLCAPPGKQKNS